MIEKTTSDSVKVNNRTLKAIQSGKKKSLAEAFPEIAKEWCYEKNGDLTPEMVTYSSHEKVWWQCTYGHKWPANISNRTNFNSGCPYCAGQKVLTGFNDLATIRPDIAAEWHSTKNADLTPEMVTSGSNNKVWWKGTCGHEWEAVVNSRVNQKQGCPFCSGHRILSGFNDLATKYPDIVTEWHPDKNGDLIPEMVAAKSGKKVWWLGKCGHEWETTPANRVIHNSGCPYCAGKKVLLNFNDLATAHPEIASEWHPTKNGKLTPEMVTTGSSKKEIWWKCKYGHEWKSTVANRTRGNGCPYCAGKKVLPGFNDLMTQNP